MTNRHCRDEARDTSAANAGSQALHWTLFTSGRSSLSAGSVFISVPLVTDRSFLFVKVTFPPHLQEEGDSSLAERRVVDVRMMDLRGLANFGKRDQEEESGGGIWGFLLQPV